MILLCYEITTTCYDRSRNHRILQTSVQPGIILSDTLTPDRACDGGEPSPVGLKNHMRFVAVCGRLAAAAASANRAESKGCNVPSYLVPVWMLMSKPKTLYGRWKGIGRARPELPTGRVNLLVGWSEAGSKKARPRETLQLKV